IGGDSPDLTVPTGSLSASTHTVTVHVTGTCGLADQSADLVVQADTATTDPTDAAGCKGTDANFLATASESGPVHDAWKLDGDAIGSDSPNLTVPTGSLSVSTHVVTVHVTGTCGSADQSADLVVQVVTLSLDKADVGCNGGNDGAVIA